MSLILRLRKVLQLVLNHLSFSIYFSRGEIHTINFPKLTLKTEEEELIHAHIHSFIQSSLVKYRHYIRYVGLNKDYTLIFIQS